MPADPESTGWAATLLGAFGVGGGGSLLKLFTTQSTHGSRIDRLEEDRKEHDGKIEATHTTVTQLDTKLESVQGDVTAIRGMLENYGRADR